MPNGEHTRIVDVKILTPVLQDQAFGLLIDAFYLHRTDITREQALMKLRTQVQRGKEVMFCLLGGEQVVGVSSYILYDYGQIRSQLYMQVRYQQHCLTAMRLVQFHELLCSGGITQGEHALVAGFGYTYVLPAYRRKGLARLLFSRRQEAICSHDTVGVVFAIVRGPYAQENVSQPIMTFFLNAEEQANGRGSDQRVRVTGIWVSTTDLEQTFHLPISSLHDASGSVAMTKLIAEYGFVPMGFFRSLSPVWATTRQQLLTGT